MPVSVPAANPYPGIRSFEADESHLFYGRKEHAEQLLRLLSEHRFLAVVGGSGSGKSSLVKAGLLPRLYRGYMPGATSRWRIALFRPGAHPVLSLAESLGAPKSLEVGPVEKVQATLESSSVGLVEVMRSAELPPGENLLVVVDQFEEIFRFRHEEEHGDSAREVTRFVDLLLTSAQFDLPIYVVLTMRSDFLGDCTQFPGLPEALNRAQYLIPRLTREQREQAIVLPLDNAGVDIAPALVQRLLNDAGDDPDQLPALQHSLMRLYRAQAESSAPDRLDIALYAPELAVGRSLDSHATSLLGHVSEQGYRTAMRLFRCLTTVEDGRAVRRPTKIARIYAILGTSSEEDRERIRDVIHLYAHRDNSLLLSSTGDALSDETVIDITHETLIRQWALLKEWVGDEAESAEWLSRLVRAAELHAEGKARYWGDPDARLAWERASSDGWNRAWADQYGGGFDEAMAFLTGSRALIEAEATQEQDRREKELEARTIADLERKKADVLRRGRVRLIWAAAALLIAVIVLAWLANDLSAEKQRVLVLSAEARAAETRARAAENTARARTSEVEALHATGAERERLLKDAQELKAKAQQLEQKASKADTFRSALDATLSRIENLQTQLETLKQENTRLASYSNQASARESSKNDPVVDGLKKQIADLAGQVKQLTGERDAAYNKLAAMNQSVSTAPKQQPDAPTSKLDLIAGHVKSTLELLDSSSPVCASTTLKERSARVIALPGSGEQVMLALSNLYRVKRSDDASTLSIVNPVYQAQQRSIMAKDGHLTVKPDLTFSFSTEQKFPEFPYHKHTYLLSVDKVYHGCIGVGCQTADFTICAVDPSAPGK